MDWKLFDGASVRHISGKVWVLTTAGAGSAPPFYVTQKSNGEHTSLGINDCSPAELRAIADDMEGLVNEFPTPEQAAKNYHFTDDEKKQIAFLSARIRDIMGRYEANKPQTRKLEFEPTDPVLHFIREQKSIKNIWHISVETIGGKTPAPHWVIKVESWGEHQRRTAESNRESARQSGHD